MLNVRDIGPLAAGLFFHPLSGVISGLRLLHGGSDGGLPYVCGVHHTSWRYEDGFLQSQRVFLPLISVSVLPCRPGG